MKMTKKQQTNCEDFEPLISAMIDGELEPDELAYTQSHVDDCACCQAKVTSFENVDRAMFLLSSKVESSAEFSDATSTDQRQTEVFVVSREKSSLKDWISPWRLVPLGAAAALLIGVGMTMFPQPQPVTANQFSPEQYVQPMKELYQINVQQQRDQELMLRTLGMDLRALKLELQQLESGSTDHENLAQQVDVMLEKVRQFDTADF
jgi:hypothetical protein